MLTTTNTAVAVPSQPKPSASVPQTQNSFAPVHVWNHPDNSVPTTTPTTSTSADRIKSFFDFRPLRTGSNEAVVGDNSTSTKAPYRLSSFSDTPISAVEATKPRSLSAGRTRPSGGVDLVQDIYDRLGISRGDLASSSKTSTGQQGDIRQSFLNYRNGPSKETSAVADSKTSMTRGRSTMQNSADTGITDDGQLRSRSLSRGRQFRSIWPPSESIPTSTITAPTKATAMTGISGPNPTSPKYRRTDDALDPVLSPSQQRSNAIVCSPDEVVAAMLSPSRLSLNRGVILQKDDELRPTSKSSPTRTATNYKAFGASTEDKTASTVVSTSNDDESAPSGISVKERMRAFSEPTKKTTTDSKKSKSTTAPARSYPPLIDIFAEERKRYQNDNIDGMEVDEEKKDDDIEYTMPGVRQLQQRQSAAIIDSPKETAMASPSASRGKGTALANTFLAAIQTSPMEHSPRNGPKFTFAPINEIATDDHGCALDTGSVSILSSVGSHDDLNHMTTLPMSRGNVNYNGTTTHIRKPSWIDNRSKQPQRGPVNTGTKPGATSAASSGQYQFLPSSTITNSNSELPKQPTSTSIIIERMVEERVQAKVAELERRMEQQMRTYMDEMDAKMASIIAAYENEK